MKRILVELGCGVDLHGEDPTRAAARAIDDAIHRSCLCMLQEAPELWDLQKITVEVQIGCPHPEKLDQDFLKAQLPFGKVLLTCKEGGLAAEGVYDAALGRNGEIYAAVVSVTIWIDQDF